jgi:hypothetical protein
VIGATTRDEYERWILPDAALERRFHPLEVAALGREQTLEVLRARPAAARGHHTRAITDEAPRAGVRGFGSRPRSRSRPQAAGQGDRPARPGVRSRALRHPQPLPDEIAALVSERRALLAAERASRTAAGARHGSGTPLERFSVGTYRRSRRWASVSNGW